VAGANEDRSRFGGGWSATEMLNALMNKRNLILVLCFAGALKFERLMVRYAIYTAPWDRGCGMRRFVGIWETCEPRACAIIINARVVPI